MEFLLPAVSGISIFANIAAFVYFSRKGGATAANDVIAIMEKRDIEQKEQIREYQTKFEILNKEIGILQGSNQEQNKKIEEYMRIFQGRNPELEKFMENQTLIGNKAVPFMDETSKVLQHTCEIMEKMLPILESLVKR